MYNFFVSYKIGLKTIVRILKILCVEIKKKITKKPFWSLFFMSIVDRTCGFFNRVIVFNQYLFSINICVCLHIVMFCVVVSIVFIFCWRAASITIYGIVQNALNPDGTKWFYFSKWVSLTAIIAVLYPVRFVFNLGFSVWFMY